MTKFFNTFCRDEKGVTLVEYGIALVLAIVVGLGGLTLLGEEVDAQMDQATGIMADDNPA